MPHCTNRYIVVLAGDVRRAADGQIWVWGKERNESAPILSETLSVLSELAPASLSDDQSILRSRRIRNGGTEPLGEKGMHQMNEHPFLAGLALKFTGITSDGVSPF